MTGKEGLSWLRDWAPVISMVVMLAAALGFLVSTPADAISSLDRRVSALEAQMQLVNGLARYTCFADYQHAAPYLPCDRIAPEARGLAQTR